MDELLHHCLRELSFDGDLGCDVSRLRDFIVGFYAQNPSFHPQTVDEDFCAFLWSVAVRNQTVRVGTVPHGAATEVYVAPQTSAKRKAIAKGEEHVQEAASALDIVRDAKNRSLDDLKREYGDTLRICVDPEASFAAITGSHIRFPKLSPMVYTALQFVTRGRENGISVVDLGKKSGYDQKTCFYLIKQLLELGLVVKVRRGGVGSHFCIHKYFYERSPLWRQIRDEETKANEDLQGPSQPSDDVSPDAELATSGNTSPSLKFEPMDARHLSSLPLIRARVVKLLKASKNFIHECNNMLLKLGFSNPTKTDRRFFQSRIRELIQQGIIEKVLVPNKKKKDMNFKVKCFRLVTSEGSHDGDDEDVIVQPQGDDERDEYRSFDDQGGIKTNLTLHKQITDLLDDAGTTGMTLNEMSIALGHFDKRTIELLLTRAERNPPLSHLRNFGIAALMETHGRERRNRYYTLASYCDLVTQENLDHSADGYANVDFNDVGGFAPFDPSLFYEKDDILFRYQDTFRDNEKAKIGKPKKYPPKNPILPDGSVKKGRPRKIPLRGVEDRALEATLDKVETQGKTHRHEIQYDFDGGDVDDGKSVSHVSKKRRIDPYGNGKDIDHNLTARNFNEGGGIHTDELQEEASTPKKRGRPPKKVVPSVGADIDLIPTQHDVHRGVEVAQEAISLERDRLPIKKAIGSTETPISHDVEGSTRMKRGRPKTPSNACDHELVVDPVAVHGGDDKPTVPENIRPKKRSRVEDSATNGHSHLQGLPLQIRHPDDAESFQDPTNPSQVLASDFLTEVLNPSELQTSNNAHDTTEPNYSNLAVNIETVPVTVDSLVSANLQQIEAETSIPIDPSICSDKDGIVQATTELSVYGTSQTSPEKPNQGSTDSSQVHLVKHQLKSSRAKVNVSHLRRENELFRVVEGFGGIANLHTKEFFDSHMALIEAMAKAGEPTSSPAGVRIDKRTASTAIDSMEARGRIKKLKTSVLTPTGVSRPACVIYLPGIDQDKLNAYLGDLGRSVHPAPPEPIKKIEERVDYGADRHHIQRGPISLQTEEPGKVRRKTRHKTLEEKAKKIADAKILLSRKAAEARIQREKDWDDILLRAHPGPLKGSTAVRVRRVRTRFLQSGSGKDTEKWEQEINDALREAMIASSKLLKKRPKNAPPKVPPPLSTNPPEKSIDSLIALQGSSLHSRSTEKKRKGKNKAESTEVPVAAKPQASVRRHRFQWTRDFDELARDASAIIKSRCRNGPRLDLAAFEQVFPTVPRNTVRQRLAHLRETPGNDAYLNRLEEKWHELWLQHRGTSLLPDEDPQSPSNFNLIKHIEFLRKHVDKNALRIGFGQLHEKAITKISASVNELLQHWDVFENMPAAPPWDFMWNATVEEGREKGFLQQAFTISSADMPAISSSDDVCLAESALKMVFGTPHAQYDSERASRLLHNVGEEIVFVATKNLLSRGILSKTIRDPQKSKPGRTLKISEVNQNALGGVIPRDTFQDAMVLEDISSQQEDVWREWPLLASDGDIATLCQLVSDDKVVFKIDTSQAQAARPILDWNSKKADDDQIETTISVCFHQMSSMIERAASTRSSPVLQCTELDSEPALEHGNTVDGDLACCKIVSSGLVDCAACLEIELSKLLSKLSEEEKELALRILTSVRLAESTGVTKDELFANVDASSSQIFALVHQVTESPVPLLFWSGYSSPVLISSAYLRRWTVITSESPRTRIHPRRWLDISGSKINDIWEAALKAIIGVILLRPGISQAEVIWRMRSVYDEQEVRDVLRYLQEEELIEIKLPREYSNTTVAQDDSDERSRFWLVGQVRHWYQA